MEFPNTPVVAEDLWQEFLVECEDMLYAEELIWHECDNVSPHPERPCRRVVRIAPKGTAQGQV